MLIPRNIGRLRFCIDFRILNQFYSFDPYPIPKEDDLFERVDAARYITTLDLNEGYWQVDMDPKIEKLIALKMLFDKYHFKVVYFGLLGDPATLPHLMSGGH